VEHSTAQGIPFALHLTAYFETNHAVLCNESGTFSKTFFSFHTVVMLLVNSIGAIKSLFNISHLNISFI
jgi:hypothetical protein